MGRTSHRRFVALAALAVFGPLFLLGCGDDSSSTSSTATTSAAPTTTGAATGGSATTTGAATATTAPVRTTAPAGQTIEITVANGKVDNGGRKQVDKGTPLTLRVTSDVADEVHVHGYDLKADVSPGQPAVITFTPDAGGVFEVELEHKGVQLAQLEVR
jgi:hypothetical protein